MHSSAIFNARFFSRNVQQTALRTTVRAMLSDAVVKWYANDENTQNKLENEKEEIKRHTERECSQTMRMNFYS